MTENLDIAVVLCEPQGPKNVGAVCRAMKNMGLSHLRLVSPEFSEADSIEEIYTAALSARDVYESSERYTSLREALSDVTLSFGFTARKGKYRKFFAFTPREMAEKIAELPSGKIALVFGNERRGLTNSQLQLCSAAVYIPASPLYPSLNLSHAVQIAAYEIFLQFSHSENPPKSENNSPPGGKKKSENSAPDPYRPISHRKLESLIDELMETLDAFGYFDKAYPEETRSLLWDVFGRSGMCEKEHRILQKMFRKLRYLPRKPE